MQVTQMPLANAAKLVANNDNTAYGVNVIESNFNEACCMIHLWNLRVFLPW